MDMLCAPCTDILIMPVGWIALPVSSDTVNNPEIIAVCGCYTAGWLI